MEKRHSVPNRSADSLNKSQLCSDDYIRNYYETTRNALLVTGARQIGKTYSIRQFGKSFKSFVEINFIEMPEAVELFKGAKSSGDMLLRILVITAGNAVGGVLLPLCRGWIAKN